MSEFTAGSASGTDDGGIGPWNGGTPPPILLGALGVALLIGITIIAFAVGSSGGGGGGAGVQRLPANEASSTAPASDADVALTINISGSGTGRVRVAGRGISCEQSCDHTFVSGTRITLTADAASRSHFDGWGDSCSGKGRCELVMDRARTLEATFELGASTTIKRCGNGVAAADCGDSPSTTPSAKPHSDCSDGKDNDGDGLTDAAEDPGCDKGNEAADDASSSTTPPAPIAPPPPPAATSGGANDCNDGVDNDGDGLTDTAQDPDCANGNSESGSGGSATSPPPAASSNDCHDGKDNDGDGLTDAAQDPGCAHGSEGAPDG